MRETSRRFYCSLGLRPIGREGDQSPDIRRCPRQNLDLVPYFNIVARAILALDLTVHY